ncbi:MAG: hypothetical protein ACRDGM_02560 [bacterium]
MTRQPERTIEAMSPRSVSAPRYTAVPFERAPRLLRKHRVRLAPVPPAEASGEPRKWRYVVLALGIVVLVVLLALLRTP